MKISRIINNNVVSTCDEEGREVIVMGRGVGFKAKEGSTIDEDKIEKVFRLDSQNTCLLYTSFQKTQHKGEKRVLMKKIDCKEVTAWQKC